MKGDQMIHTQSSELAGKTVKIKENVTHPQYPTFGGSEFRVEDWWDRVSGKSWMYSNGNPACLFYAMRSAMQNPILPNDDEVLYGKVGLFGSLVHISEIEIS
jgi:hypothetical protein